MSDTDAAPRYPAEMGERIAKLEVSQAGISESVRDLKAEFRSFRSDILQEFRAVRADGRNQFYWLLAALAGLLGVVAHGFHWF